VLDVACGTGVLAREAHARVGSQGRVVGLDANADMLSVAARKAPAITWQRGQAEALPFAEASFDVVVSQFGLMFFADREQALREILRVLTPSGRWAVAVWDALEMQPPCAVEVALVERVVGKAAADALRAPFVLGERDALQALFRRAGIQDAEIVTRRAAGRFPSVRAMVSADLRGWLPVMGIVLPEAQIERLLESYVDDQGRMVFDSLAHIVSGRAFSDR
jgi:SAM-dependent methyltransferase